jgi:DNA-binding GntR family transcriptional regulator
MESMSEAGSQSLGAILDDASVSRERRASLQVYALLRRAIISLQLVPNRPISEQDVANRLSVSRTPVREAFIRLAEEGLLITYPQLATVISPIRMEALLEAQFLREAVECALAERAARTIDEDGIVRLRSVLARHAVAFRAEKWMEFHQLDEDTHQLICEIAGLSGLGRQIEHARGHLDRVRYLTLPEIETSQRVVAQHTTVVEAICENRPEDAREAMRIHVRDLLPRLPSLREQYPDFFEDKPQFARRQQMR